MGISPDLIERIRETMLRCGPLRSSHELRAAFVDSRISPWRYVVPDAGNEFGRATTLIDELHNKQNSQGENALVLLLRVLSGLAAAGTACRGQLLGLADELARELSEPETTVTQQEGIPLMGTTQLRDLLTKIYSSAADARRVAQDAGLSLAHINFSQTPINIWYEILNEAEKQAKIDAIVAIGRREYPAQPWPSVAAGGTGGGTEGSRVRRELSTKEKQELTKAFLAVPSMASSSQRQVVISQLPAEIATKIPGNAVDNIHVLNIVTTCLRYKNGLEELLDTLRFAEGDSTEMEALEETVRRLLP